PSFLESIAHSHKLWDSFLKSVYRKFATQGYECCKNANLLLTQKWSTLWNWIEIGAFSDDTKRARINTKRHVFLYLKGLVA
ncbi:hypothetical protein, partial [Faecalibaculum rodentium]